MLFSIFSPLNVLLTKISVRRDNDLHVLISSKKTQNSLLFLSFSSLAIIFIFIISLIISLSVIPEWIWIIPNNSSPLFKNWDNFIISEVLPQPVSPIIITGISAFIL